MDDHEINGGVAQEDGTLASEQNNLDVEGNEQAEENANPRTNKTPDTITKSPMELLGNRRFVMPRKHRTCLPISLTRSGKSSKGNGMFIHLFT